MSSTATQEEKKKKYYVLWGDDDESRIDIRISSAPVIFTLVYHNRSEYKMINREKANTTFSLRLR